MASNRTSHKELIARLTGYWKLEAANVLLVPGIIIFLTEARLSWLTLITFVPMMGLLVIGAIYWRAKLAQIEHKTPIEQSVRRIAKWQYPLLILTILSLVAAATLWLFPDWSRGRADQWAATGAAILALLEYVNYYHRQLQHFDHWADWKRLMSGRGFRTSQLRQDINRFC